MSFATFPYIVFPFPLTVKYFYPCLLGSSSSINTDEHDAGHSINSTADHFIKHICLTFLDAFFGVTHQPTQQWSMTEWYEQIQWLGFGSSPFSFLFTPFPYNIGVHLQMRRDFAKLFGHILFRLPWEKHTFCPSFPFFWEKHTFCPSLFLSLFSVSLLQGTLSRL